MGKKLCDKISLISIDLHIYVMKRDHPGHKGGAYYYKEDTKTWVPNWKDATPFETEEAACLSIGYNPSHYGVKQNVKGLVQVQ